MIVIGTDVVENYLADRAGHKGVRAARSHYESWLGIATRTEWRNPQDVKAAYPKVSILKAGRVVFNIKGNDFRLVARIKYQAGIVSSDSLVRMESTTRSMRRRCDGCRADPDR